MRTSKITKIFFKKSVIVLFLTVFVLSASQTYAIDGVYSIAKGFEDKVPKDASLDKVKVVEVFSISCIHCYNFFKGEKSFKKRFGDKIDHTYIEIGWIGPNLSKFIYFAEDNNKLDEARHLFFTSFHEAGIRDLNNPKTLGVYAKELDLPSNYVKQINEQKVTQKFVSGGSFVRKYKVNSTPTFVVEDSILVKGSNAENLALVINSLLKNPVK